MASTNKTPLLGLNQWVLSDPFLMEDMNEDNRRIDEAAGANPYHKLIDITATANAQQIDLDVSQIDFSKYAMIQIFADLPAPLPINTAAVLYVKINNAGGVVKDLYASGSPASAAQSYVGKGYISNDTPIHTRALFEITGIQNSSTGSVYRVRSSVVAYRNGNVGANDSETVASVLLAAGTRPTSINFLTDSASAYLQAGSRIVVYGVKV